MIRKIVTGNGSWQGRDAAWVAVYVAVCVVPLFMLKGQPFIVS